MEKEMNLRQSKFHERWTLSMEVIPLVWIDKIPLAPDTIEPNIMKP